MHFVFYIQQTKVIHVSNDEFKMSLNGCTQINIFAFLQVYDLQICAPDFPHSLMPKSLPPNCFFADENVALKYLVECIHMKLIHNAGFTSTEMYYSAFKSQIISHMYIFLEW